MKIMSSFTHTIRTLQNSRTFCEIQKKIITISTVLVHIMKVIKLGSNQQWVPMTSIVWTKTLKTFSKYLLCSTAKRKSYELGAT